MPDTITPTPSTHIRIVGGRRLQNELIAHFLTQKTGLTPVYPLGNETPVFGVDPKNPTSLTIVDWSTVGQHVPIESFAPAPTESSSHLVVFWNVGRDQGVERRAIKAGIRGLFYENDPLSVLVKGLEAVLRGEMWYSREILSKVILANNLASTKPEGTPVPILSGREREILGLLANGKNNNQIATQLNISPHTVRTHLYNIYGKIKVNSRIQAMLWAARYL